tara:strand:- start:540 stop:998 length:459 start_codon:yes stop_codon:yes gene_type:complete
MADKSNDDEILAKNLLPFLPVGVRGETTTEQRYRTGKRPINILTNKGTQTNVPEAGGKSVRYRQQMGTGRRGKQASDVFLMSEPAGGDAGYVGLKTIFGKMKYKAAGTSPEGEVTTKFINPFRAKRAREAIEDTPAMRFDPRTSKWILREKK